MTNKKTPAKKSPAKRAPAKKSAAKPAAKKASPVKKTAAAKKGTATKTAAKKTTAKAAAKTTARKATAKAPAKKTAAKKTAAKKTTAKAATKTTTKKATAKATKAAAAAGSATTKRAPKKKVESPFTVGDYVVYPHHGAATIIKLEKIDFDGDKQEYFVLEIATDQLTVRVPVAKAVELGVRPVISQNKTRQVFRTFKEEPQEAGKNWSRWYKLLTEKINSGDIFQVAEVVRDLTYAQQVKGIPPALKRMLAKARLIIVSELRFALDLDEEEAVKKLDRALPKVEVPEEE